MATESSKESLWPGLRYALLVAIGLLVTTGTLSALSSGVCDQWLGLDRPDLPRNFHAVEEGRLYRSAQFTPEQLMAAVDLHGIRTVINLRGANPESDWYRQERETCEAMGVTLIDHGISANALPSPDAVRAIVESLRTAEPPVLLHCRAGADRTGAIAAIYRMAVLGEDREHALHELSPEYMHFRAYAPCMDTLAEHYEPTDEWFDGYAAELPDLVCE